MRICQPFFYITKKPLNCCLRSNLQFKGFLSAKGILLYFSFYIFVFLSKKHIYGSAKISSPKITLLPCAIPLDSPNHTLPSVSINPLAVAGAL